MFVDVQSKFGVIMFSAVNLSTRDLVDSCQNLSKVIMHTLQMQQTDVKLKKHENLPLKKQKLWGYFSARFRPSVTASFLAFSRDSALDLRPSLTP